MGLSRSVGTALFICFLIREAPQSKVPQSVSMIEQVFEQFGLFCPENPAKCLYDRADLRYH